MSIQTSSTGWGQTVVVMGSVWLVAEGPPGASMKLSPTNPQTNEDVCFPGVRLQMQMVTLPESYFNVALHLDASRPPPYSDSILWDIIIAY